MDSIIAANLLCESVVQTLSEEEIRTYVYIYIQWTKVCVSFFPFTFRLFWANESHTPGILYIYVYSTGYILLEICMVCLRNVSTRPITIHADMFAVYWSDAFRTTRNRLPDSVDATAAHTHTHTHIQYGFRVVCTLLMAFSQYLLYHVSINGWTFLYTSCRYSQCYTASIAHASVLFCAKMFVYSNFRVPENWFFFFYFLSISLSHSIPFYLYGLSLEMWKLESNRRMRKKWTPSQGERETQKFCCVDRDGIRNIFYRKLENISNGKRIKKNIIFLLIRTFWKYWTCWKEHKFRLDSYKYTHTHTSPYKCGTNWFDSNLVKSDRFQNVILSAY